MQPAIYILASRPHGALYIGVTNDLVRRVWQHKNDENEGHTYKYHVHLLVHYETFTRMEDAIIREKQLKEWHRAWKDRLIEETNPDWHDLWPEICGAEGMV